ncbi:MAG: L-threonylcarbamoyladenylate synthase [Myxococcota bacterium]|nr:L-threonylcarbamoyladenylate synthase [Myxococcota bacterium]
MILELDPHHPSPYRINRFVEFLERGELIAIPTDTCYALACLPNLKGAVERLVRLRGLEAKKPRSLMFGDIRHVSEYTLLGDVAFRSIRRHLPGPYSFILEANRKLPRFLGDKRKRVGVRVPDHPVPQALIGALGSPLMVASATSPEVEGEIIQDPWTLEAIFGHGLAGIIDAGEVPGGVSTVVDLSTDDCELLRVGLGDPSAFTV